MKRLVGAFVRDGFTDRYFGDPLVFPGTLRALALLFPQDFPYHPNWKQSATHPAIWELYPTIDQVVPVARGGANDEANIVTTSMLRNSAKGNWLIEELGWPIDRAPLIAGWDGLLGWFMSTASSHALLRGDIAIQRWHQAARELNVARTTGSTEPAVRAFYVVNAGGSGPVNLVLLGALNRDGIRR